MTAAIELREASRAFGSVIALDGVSLEIARASSSRCSGPPAPARRPACG